MYLVSECRLGSLKSGGKIFSNEPSCSIRWFRCSSETLKDGTFDDESRGTASGTFCGNPLLSGADGSHELKGVDDRVP